MRHNSFGSYTDKKKRESIHHLRIVKQLLEHNGMKVENFLDTDDEDHDPYVFCFNPAKTGSFDGIRIYELGGQCCFRIQKESKTHPYGSAYPLPIPDMFSDFLSDEDVDEKKAGEKIIEAVSREIRKFFEKSVEADRQARERDIEKDTAGNVLTRTTGTDYSALIFSKA